jgi:hypothetical protein
VGAPVTSPNSSLSAIAGGSTADVITATLMPGSVGYFQVLLHLNIGLPTNSTTTLTIAQDTFVSGTVSLPVLSKGPQ